MMSCTVYISVDAPRAGKHVQHANQLSIGIDPLVDRAFVEEEKRSRDVVEAGALGRGSTPCSSECKLG